MVLMIFQNAIYRSPSYENWAMLLVFNCTRAWCRELSLGHFLTRSRRQHAANTSWQDLDDNFSFWSLLQDLRESFTHFLINVSNWKYRSMSWKHFEIICLCRTIWCQTCSTYHILWELMWGALHFLFKNEVFSSAIVWNEVKELNTLWEVFAFREICVMVFCRMTVFYLPL